MKVILTTKDIKHIKDYFNKKLKTPPDVKSVTQFPDKLWNLFFDCIQNQELDFSISVVDHLENFIMNGVHFWPGYSTDSSNVQELVELINNNEYKIDYGKKSKDEFRLESYGEVFSLYKTPNSDKLVFINDSKKMFLDFKVFKIFYFDFSDCKLVIETKYNRVFKLWI